MKNSIGQHVLLQMVAQRVLDFEHRLMNRDRTNGASALVVARTGSEFFGPISSDGFIRAARL